MLDILFYFSTAVFTAWIRVGLLGCFWGFFPTLRLLQESMHYQIILKDIRTKAMVLDSNDKTGLNTNIIPVPVSEVFTKCCMLLQASFEDESHWQRNRFEATLSMFIPVRNTVFHYSVKLLNILPPHMKIKFKILLQQSGINELLQVTCAAFLHLRSSDMNKFT